MVTKLKNAEMKGQDAQAQIRSSSWMMFFLGVNLLIISVALIVHTTLYMGGLPKVQTLLQDNDVKRQPAFENQMRTYFELATGAAVGDEDKLRLNSDWGYYFSIGYAVTEAETTMLMIDGVAENEDASVPVQGRDFNAYLQFVQQILDAEGVNLEYYILAADQTVLTSTNQPLLGGNNQVLLPKGYDYYLAYDGEQLLGYYEKTGFFNLEDSGYNRHQPAFTKQYQEGGNYLAHYPQLKDCRIVLAVKTDLEENYYGSSALYDISKALKPQRYCLVIATVLGAIALLFLVASFLGRQMKRRFDRVLAEFSAKIWLEFKLAAAVVLAIGFFAMFVAIDAIWYDDWLSSLCSLLLAVSFALICFWLLYILAADLLIHKRSFFQHNMLNSYLAMVRSEEALKPFQERLMNRLTTLLKTEGILLLVALLTIFTVIIPIFAIAFGLYLLGRFVKQYKELIQDLGKISDQIERIKGGDMDTPLHLSPLADLYPMAKNLNSVQEGVVTATEQKMKSERMKIDLVTNVSHDLKTPLTSIISYTDLLSQEDDLSETAQDYVRILRQKSERLRALINDLFDLSKATSANLDVHLEHIDFGKLLNQVLAELGEEIEQSQLSFKVQIPNEPIPIISDGAKMHRVFDNLLLNAIKYSLEGSRVFVDIKIKDGLATATIKNIAKYEMDFDEETIIGRFVRGDKARSTEGSGLGLAIAQSYTEACGGLFELAIDGDLFKVSVTFDTQAAKDAAEKLAAQAKARILAEDDERESLQDGVHLEKISDAKLSDEIAGGAKPLSEE